MSFLRREVTVDFTGLDVSVYHGFWSLRLPLPWVREVFGLENFFKREVSSDSVNNRDSKTLNVLGLLELAGCLTRKPKKLYSMREVRDLFEPLCLTWHSIYYKHSIWERLQSGKLSKNSLVAWILHNYHLSRSAGTTASRCVSRSDRPDIRQLFLDSALEEYSHCQEHYNVDDIRLGITQDDAQNYIPLRSSLAFDHQMFRLAEEDWLAHILVGYFQESTAVYYKQCCEFYRDVETQYKIDGFFEAWKGHIRLDLNYGHASAFTDALNNENTISHEAVAHSLQNVAFTAEFLLDALDEIVALERADDLVIPRLPITFDAKSLQRSGLLADRKIEEKDWAFSASASLPELCHYMDRAGILSSKIERTFSEEELDFVRSQVVLSLVRALSHAKSHNEIIALGRMVEANSALAAKTISAPVSTPPTAWAASVSNYLLQIAVDIHSYAIALYILKLYARNNAQLNAIIPDGATTNGIENVISKAIITETTACKYLNEVIQWMEVVAYPYDHKRAIVDLFD